LLKKFSSNLIIVEKNQKNKKNLICETEDLKASIWSIEKKEINII
jgi:hypothetical protein